MSTPDGPIATLTASPLARTVAETPTDIWNDSCAVDELEYAVAFGAVGATANPTIVVDNWKKDPGHWAGRVRSLAAEQPAWEERALAWAIVEEMSVRAAPLLLPAFEASGGRAGRLSVQTDPTLFRNANAMVEQAAGFDRLAPNIVVKFPATSAGVAAMEEASYRGISVNATVSFSVPQAIAAAEAVQRGIERREADGKPTDKMGPVITIMMGRIEDWLRVLVDRDGLVVHPSALPWSGVAVFKRAYAEWQQRGFRARLLGAAIRHHLHWTELIDGDVIITMPSSWQKRFNASSVEVRPRIDDPVPYVDELRSAFPDFVRAYEPDGLALADFDGWGPTVRTLRAFIGSYHELLHLVTDALLPNPDV
jgi:transaldolase